MEIGLSVYSTKDLCAEIATREGVQLIYVKPHEQRVEISVNNDDGQLVFNDIFEGPQTILRVYD